MTFTSSTPSTSPVTHKTAIAAALRADCIGGSVDGPVTLTLSYTVGGESIGCTTRARDRGDLRERLKSWSSESLLPEDWE